MAQWNFDISDLSEYYDGKWYIMQAWKLSKG